MGIPFLKSGSECDPFVSAFLEPRRLLGAGCEWWFWKLSPPWVGDELRASRRLRCAGELRVVFTGDRERGKGNDRRLAGPLSKAAGPAPRSAQGQLLFAKVLSRAKVPTCCELHRLAASVVVGVIVAVPVGLAGRGEKGVDRFHAMFVADARVFDRDAGLPTSTSKSH